MQKLCWFLREVLVLKLWYARGNINEWFAARCKQSLSPSRIPMGWMGVFYTRSLPRQSAMLLQLPTDLWLSVAKSPFNQELRVSKKPSTWQRIACHIADKSKFKSSHFFGKETFRYEICRESLIPLRSV